MNDIPHNIEYFWFDCFTENKISNDSIFDIRQMLKDYPNITNIVNHQKESALHLLCKNIYHPSYIKILSLLLKQPNIQLNVLDDFSETPLMKTAQSGKFDAARNMIKNSDLDVNIQNFQGWTALMFAVHSYSLNIFKLLLQHPNINLSIKNDDDDDFLALMDNYNIKPDYYDQLKILEKEPLMIKRLIEYGMLSPKNKIIYQHLITSNELNLI